MNHPRSPQEATPNFAGCDCRNRSFRGRSLIGADFTGADLRGCDFTRANLTGANLTQARLGQTRRQWFLRCNGAIAAFLLSGHAISNLVFGSLGQTPSDKAWNYVIALVVSLSLAGARPGLQWLRQTWHWRGSVALSVIAGGAILGFFYVGTTFGKMPQWAIAGAVGMGLGAGIWGYSNSPLHRIASQMVSAIAAYGLMFLCGSTTLGWLGVGRLPDGLLLGAIALLYLGFADQNLRAVTQTIAQAPGTCFRRAILTDAQITPAQLAQADLTNAIDPPNFTKTAKTH